MKNVGNSSDRRSQGVPKISGHPCIGRMGALRGHLCDSTAFLLSIFWYLKTAILGPWRSLKSDWILSFEFAMNSLHSTPCHSSRPTSQTLTHHTVHRVTWVAAWVRGCKLPPGRPPSWIYRESYFMPKLLPVSHYLQAGLPNLVKISSTTAELLRFGTLSVQRFWPWTFNT